MKTTSAALLSLLVIQSVNAQNFVNLDFESADLPAIPEGQYGGRVPISQALPGWLGLTASTPADFVFHNNFALGSPSISIFGPSWTSAQGVIEGRYTALLQSGVVSGDASIFQTGMIPLGTQSIQFWAAPTSDFMSMSDFAVLFAGQQLNLVLLPADGAIGFTRYGVDATGIDGLTGELKFTALANSSHPNNFLLDSISFSVMPVPEPATWTLLGLTGLVAGIVRWQISRQK
jgi:PEP-CTERM motif